MKKLYEKALSLLLEIRDYEDCDFLEKMENLTTLKYEIEDMISILIERDEN